MIEIGSVGYVADPVTRVWESKRCIDWFVVLMEWTTRLNSAVVWLCFVWKHLYN